VWRYRNIAHYLAGIITALSYILSPVLPILGAGLFIIYELNEDWHLHDRAYHDILEFMIGFYFCLVGLIIREVL